MKITKSALIVLMMLLILGACKKDKPGSNVSAPPQSAQGATVGSASTPISPGNSREAQLLMTNFWVAEFYVIPLDQGQIRPARERKGLWWQFLPDGTYLAGQWEKQFDNGSWFLRQGPQYALLFIDSAVDDQKDTEFQIQGIAKENDVMSWVKEINNSANQEPAMLKMITLMTRPTKRQFGLPEDAPTAN